MRAKSITIRGMGPFHGTATLDLSTLPGRLVAIVGSNGAGKSTFCELAGPGVLYRSLPTRGDGGMSRLALGRDSYVEAAYETPVGAITVRQSLDSVSGKSEALVLGSDGAPLLPSTSVRAFDAWAAERLPALDVYLTSLYSAQGSGGIFDLGDAERRRVILSALGIERHERMAEAARGRASKGTLRLLDVAAQERAERARADVDAAALALRLEIDAETEAAMQDAHARGLLLDARATHAALVAAFNDAEAAQARYRQADHDERNARASYRAVTDLVNAAEDKVRGAADVDAAVAALPDAESAVEAATREAERVRVDLAAANAAHLGTSRNIIDAETRLRGAEGRAAAAEKAAAGLPAARKAHEEIAGLRHEVEEAAATLAAYEAAAEKWMSAGLDVAGRRIVGLRDTLEAISEGRGMPRPPRILVPTYLPGTCFRCGVPNNVNPTLGRGPHGLGEPIPCKCAEEDAVPFPCDPRNRARMGLAADDVIAQEGAAAPENLRRAKEDVANFRAQHRKAQETLAATQRLADSVESLATHETAARNARCECDAIRSDLATLRPQEEKERARVDEMEMVRSCATHALELAVEKVRVLREKAGRAPLIAAARASLEHLAERERTARETMDAAKAALRACPEPPATPPLPPDLSALETAVAAREADLSAARGAVARAEAALDAARAAEAKADALAAERDEIARDVADWTKLADELGQKGLIAMEVDAAGPELSAIATSLLHESSGETRFTVSIATTRAHASGDGFSEVCDVTVLDTEAGTDGPAERLSGGERVVVGEAVALALTTIATRRAGLTGCTLIRDESGAALDPERSRAYVAMLRKAAELVGADRVLLVSHSQEVQQLCDSRVRIADGQFHVET